MSPVRLLLAFLLLVASALAVQPTEGTGKVVRIEKKSRERVLYYQVNTPVTADDPYYAITVQLKNTIYIAEYQPRNSEETLPAAWIADQPVGISIQGRHMRLKRPEGGELEAIIVKRFAAGAQPKLPPDKAR